MNFFFRIISIQLIGCKENLVFYPHHMVNKKFYTELENVQNISDRIEILLHKKKKKIWQIVFFKFQLVRIFSSMKTDHYYPNLLERFNNHPQCKATETRDNVFRQQ